MTQHIDRRTFHALAASSIGAALAPASFARVLGANDRIRIAVIGCGGRGTAHMNTLLGMKRGGEPIEIVAVCDTYRPRLERAASLTGATFTTMEHETLVALPDIDIVLVATPDHWHGPHTIDAMEAGKDVYCEKPLTHWRQVGLPERMVRVAEETKRIVQVGCQRMSSSAYPQARDLIRGGAIGKPLMAETGYYRIGDWGERGMPIDDPNAKPGPDLDWERFQGDAPRRAFDVSRYFRWRMYWDYSGGPGTDNYVHFYTPLAFMLDLGVPDSVVASGGKYRYEEREVPDTFNLIAEYPDRRAVLCHGTQGNDYQSQGSGDSPILRGWEGTLTFEGGQIVVRPVGGVAKPERRVPIETGTNEPRFWKELLDGSRTRTPTRSGIAVNAAVAITLQMATIAMRDGRVVRYDREKRAVV
ncbi:MAG: Gfo/Idh/MocA family oxidoreductase [Planctomycetes bacterium]|nr:Gfo/Idh/MocA family oxidoreductase [Planctomycetota bacterium]